MAKINKVFVEPETFEGQISETVPDQALGIRDILERTLAGTTPQMREYTDYDGEDPDIDMNVDERSGDYDLADFTAEMEEIEARKSKRRSSQITENV